MKLEGAHLSFENKEVPVVETVRGAIFHRGKFLILEKGPTSKSPDSLEFPGGKIDDIVDATSTKEEQIKSLHDEILQETGIDISSLPKEEIESFKTYFEAKNKKGELVKFKRLVHLYLIRIPDEEEIELKINETMNHHGESEDNHSDHKWLSPEELVKAAVFHDTEDTLLKNSRHIKKLLKEIGYLTQ
jgi:8-oxo-dGTP pyrophosphatase MutT (NUDIX family)